MNPSAGTIVVTRDDEEDIKMRGLEVLIDGEFVADLQYGQSFNRPLEPGHHTIKATNHLYTKTEEFDLANGETVQFQVANVIKGLGGMMVITLGIGPYRVRMRRVA